jgi:PKD repeat protein
MKLNYLHLIIFLLSVFSFSVNGQTFESKEAEKKVSGSRLVRTDEHNKGIKFIQLKSDYYYAATDQPNWLSKSLKFSKNHQAKIVRKETDKKGFTHSKYQIYFKNIPVEGAIYTVHAIEGKINSANGEYTLGQNISVTPTLKEQDAFDKAISYVHASSYQWESTSNSRPTGELTILPIDSTYILTYKFDIYATEPLSRQYIFVDASNGNIVKTYNRIHIIDAVGTAKTMYNGNVSITTDSYNGSYRLREAGRGNGIETYNLNHGTNYASATDFTDTDNNWTDTIDYNHAANDAHYATEATYDYYFTKFGRNSYDNNGAKIKSYVHYSRNYVNAFWDGTSMTYGDGNGTTYLPLTPIEVVAHEITHGVTEHSAGLIYSGESGALNESFSDIFGIVIDFFKNPATANYLMGDAMSLTHTPFRSMQNPNDYGCPGTYKGLYWDPSQEVHTNSGVQNHWFYFLCEGGIGTNELGNSYTITGIGREKAAKIAYRTLTVYLTPSSNYADARFYSIQSAIDLFGDCSPEVIAVTNAWYAVGVGTTYNSSVIADFVVSKTNVCGTNSPVYFSNRSSKASLFRWNFGDGQTDTARNPSHIFANTGTYSVQLIAEGSASCNNIDTISKRDLITVSSNPGPIPANCVAHTLFPGNGGIYQFRLNTIDNTTSGSIDDYRDYSCNFQTNLTEGREYDLYVKVGPNKSENIRIWIDLNNNGSFDDISELVFQKNNVTVDFSDKIIIPGGAQYNTPLRLRIISDYSTYNISGACANTNYGQVQDYAVSIQQNNSKPKANFNSNQQLIAKNDTIQFKDASLNLPNQWHWEFPGGTPATSALKNPVVIYNTPGTYNVSLIVSNPYGSDTIIKTDQVKVLDQLYCTSSLGGSGSCPGDISLVSIKGTTFNNTSHTSCSTTNGSTYGAYPGSSNTTGTLKSDTTYQLSVTTTSNDIISVWIDYNQNGLFEASEWTQVTTYSTPNVPSKVNITIPKTALMGKTGMRIRSRAAGNPNGANDACSRFGSGITEDYFVTIKNLPRPTNFSASLTNASTGQVRLSWNYSAIANSSMLNGLSQLAFTKFKIYRNGVILDSTLNNSYTDLLPAYGGYTYEVKSIYDSGEFGSSDSAKIGWYGNPQISVNPLSFNEVLISGDSVVRTMTITNNRAGMLIFNITSKSGNQIFKQINPIEKIASNNGGKSTTDNSYVAIPSVPKINIGAGSKNVLIFRDNLAWSYNVNVPILESLGANVSIARSTDMGTINLNNFQLIIFESQQPTSFYNLYVSNLARFKTYLNAGGFIEFHCASFSSDRIPNLPFPGGMQTLASSDNDTYNYIIRQSHPIVSGIVGPLQGNSASHEAFENVPANATIITNNESGLPTTVEYKYGAGTLIVTGMTWEWGYSNQKNYANMLSNAFQYALTKKSGTWLSLTPVADTLALGESVNINVKFNAKNLIANNYTDTLTITSTDVSQSIINVPCNLNVLGKPTADFKSNRNNIMVGNNIQFTDLTTGSPTQWKWVIPGGTPSLSTEKNPLVTYNTAGTYDVTLIATNPYGSDTIIKKNYITVLPKVVANFYTNSTSVTTGSYVYFYDSSLNNPTSWRWMFTGGMPSTSTYQNPSVVYNTPGTYDVKLVVSNAGGADSIVKSGYITVTLPPKPIANFYASNTTAVTGSTVYFYSTSTNNPTSWKWTFTGGTPSTSTSSNPYVVYNTPGKYDVKLVVANTGGSDSIVKTGYITITLPPKPVANFSSNTRITSIGSSVSFYDYSSNNPTSRKWTFTGGTPAVSTSNYPSVVYNTTGVYDVKLVVTNSGGADSIVKKGYITVTGSQKPISNFYANSTTISTGSSVSFNDNSANNPTTWKWVFTGGVPSSSTYSNPYVTYNTPGTYDVKMVVSNANGADSIVKTGYITVTLPTKPVANFNTNGTNITPGSYVYFSDISTNSPTSRKWTFTGGSPSVSTSSNPSVLYSTSGTYDVKLVVSNAGGSDSITKTGFINVGTTLPGDDCSNAQDLSLLRSPYSGSTTGYKSDFTFCNFGSSPDRIFYIDVPNGDSLFIGQTYNDFDSRQSLRVGGTCPGTTELYCTDDPDTYNFSYVNSTGSVQRVYFLLGGYTSSSYGNFTLAWRLTTPGIPVANFTADNTNIQPGNYVNFIDQSSGVPTSWKWTFSGGSPSNSTASNPSVYYNTPGSYNVKLVASNSYGRDSIIKTGYIKVAAPPKPVANFYANPTTTIVGSYIYFNDNSTNYPTSRKWTFTGGSPSSSTYSYPSVVYNTPGLYTVKLVVSNAGGADSVVKTQYITVYAQPKPVANFYTDNTNVIIGNYAYFYSNSGNNPTSFKWTFSGGSPSTSTSSNPYVVYNTAGVYDVKLVATNDGGADSIVKTEYITVTLPPKPVADFNASTTSTTIGSYIYFYSSSTNNPTSWRWTFSGGSPSTSTSSNPYVTYNAPGTYDVKLVATNAGGSDSIIKTGYITITPPPKPVADFSSNTSNTKTGSYVYFYDNSSYNPTSWKWTFTGGTPAASTSSYPSVVYNNPGIYDVKLVVSNTYGSDSIVKTGYITVTGTSKPVANFYANSTTIITGTSVGFNDNSANSPTSWKWTFTGGIPSSSTYSNPYVTYNTPGTYDVKMVVSNASGVDSIVKTEYITVTLPPKPVANFSATGTNITPGSYAYFSDISSNNPTSWKWTFTGGSPSVSTSSSPTVLYSTGGTYDVKLVVSNAGGSDSITKTGFINVATTFPGDDCSNAQDLSLLTSPYSGSTTGYKSDFTFCNFGSSPDRIFYIDVPNGSILNIGQTFNNFDSRHSIRVGGTCPGTTELYCVDDPDVQTHTYVNSTGSVQRVYFLLGGFSSSSSGNFTLAWRLTTPGIPVANFIADNTNIQPGSYANFTDQSSGIPTSWKWTFSGGSPSTSTSSNPSVYYNTPGSYNVKLVASNSYGRDSVVKTGYITVAAPPKPVANFYANPANTTAGSSIYFYNSSTNNPTSWKWTFTGGSPSSSTYSNPSVIYNTPGLYTVKLVVSNAGGSDSITKSQYITVAPQPKPVANFNTTNTNIIVGSYVYFYDNSGNNPTSWKWTFTGGNPSTSTSSNPYTIYNTPGTYNVKLVVFNAGGSDSIVKTGYIKVTVTQKPIANFYASSTNTTAGSNVNFYNSSLNNPTSWKWTFTGGSPSSSTASSPSVVYNNAGSYSVKLVVFNAGGADSTTKSGYITVTRPKPVASFYASPTNTLKDSTVNFYNTSTNNPTSWKWTFTGGTPSTSTLSNPRVKYNSPGTYSVRLFVSSADGADSVTKTGYIIVSLPVKDFNANATTICKNGTVIFTKTSATQAKTYTWDFGDGASPKTATTAGPHNVVYSTSGYKTVMLVADGTTKTKTNYINVVNPPKTFHASSPSSYCKGNPISITLSGSETGTTYYLYANNTNLNLPKTGNGSSLFWPDRTFGKYTILAKNDSYGCETSMPDTLSITEKPIPNTPEIFQSQNKLYSKTEIGNQWYSTKGGIITGEVANIYAPSQNGKYFVIVTAEGCSSLQSNEINVVNTGVDETKVNGSITLFPNPFTGTLYVKTVQGLIISKIEIKNILSSSILTVKPEINNEFLYPIDMATQANGYYSVILYTNKGLLTYKVLKVE